jgi:fructuronate reductase
VSAFAAAADDGAAGQGRATAFLDWLGRAVTFPSTMVDRITPTTTAEDRRIAAELLGLRDEALVVAEPFSQWVIEDDFAGDRPAWELAGAIITDDVSSYERVKLRVLNATHSLLAWLGSLCGHATIADAVADDRLRRLALSVLDDDVLPTLHAPDGLDLAAYRDEVLHRMANPALAHATAQVAADGSIKLPIRVLGTAADRLAAGVVPRGLALVVAAWIAYLDASLAAGAPPLQDPIADQLVAALGPAGSLAADPGPTVDRVLAIDAVFPVALRRHTGFRDAVVEAVATVHDLAAASAPEFEPSQSAVASAVRSIP